MVRMPTGPLRVTPAQWADVKHHYQDDFEPDRPECSICGRELDISEVEFDICDDCFEAEEGIRPDHHLEADYDTANGDIE